MSPTLKRRTVLIVITLAMLASTGWLGRAQNGSGADGLFRSDTLEMAVKPGFGKLAVNGFTGNWASFRIALANEGDSITGRLIVRVVARANPSPQYREYVKDIQLPRGSRQLHEIAAYLSSDQPPEVSVVTTDGRVVAQTSVPVARNYYGNDQLEIAVVDVDPTTLNEIAAAEIVKSPLREPFKSGPRLAKPQPQQDQTVAPPPAQPGAPPNSRPPGRRGPRWFGGGPQTLTAHPSVVAPDDMPRDFVSYDSVDVVVIGDAPLGQLSEDQARALRLWVASGGLLIVTGGADVPGLRAAGLDAMLPVQVEGTATSSAIAELTDTYGRFASPAPLLSMKARARTGARVLLGSADRVIAAEKNFGGGLVRFVAINPKLNPYHGWDSAKDVWTDLLLPAVETQSRHNNWFATGRRGGMGRLGINNVLFSVAEISPPSSKYFLLFLLFYILTVGPANYLVLRWMRKLDLAWLTIPGVVIAFTAVSVTVAQVSRGGSSIAADVSLVDLHQSEGIARVIGGLLIMPTSKDTHEISLEGGNTFANDTAQGPASSASGGDVIESQRDRERFTLRVPMSTWTPGTFQVRAMNEGLSPLVEVTNSNPPAGARNGKAAAGSSSVSLRNLSGVDINRAVYLSADGISGVFDLPAGEQLRTALGAPQAATFSAWYSGQLGEGSRENEILEELAEMLDREIGGQSGLQPGFFDTAVMTNSLKTLERPLLIGFVDEGPTPIRFRSSLKRKSKSLYVVHL